MCKHCRYWQQREMFVGRCQLSEAIEWEPVTMMAWGTCRHAQQRS